MKSKTIKKVLHSIIEKWANSVTDNLEIKKIIKEKSIVTGGCIASMITGKEVNDYDIYFTDKDAVLKLSNYYGKMVRNLGYAITVIDGKDYPNFDYNKALGMYWPDETKEDDEEEDDFNLTLENGTVINSHQLGRCVHKIESDRVKFYIPNQGVIKVDKKHYEFEDGKQKEYFPIFFSSNAITLTNDIQIVIRFHGNPDEIHTNYDYVHATSYYTFENNKLELRKEALESLLTKELKYIGSKYPITSIIRMRKFLERGFTINAGTILKICYQISELNLNDLTVLEDQLAGVDVAYFETLIDILKEAAKKEGFQLTHEFLSNLIDKIFE